MPRTALVTGGSRGIGAAAAIALARRGLDVAITYRNKAARADEVGATIRSLGVRSLVTQCDITDQADLARLRNELPRWADALHTLVLNASGGLERDFLAADPDYPWRINCAAQIAVLDTVLPQMPEGSAVVFVTSHWAHLHGRVRQLPAYEPIARSKRAGEDALRGRQDDLKARGVKLLVVTGDLIDGTITPKLLERMGPGMMAQRYAAVGEPPSAADMGERIAETATDHSLPTGHTAVVGGSLGLLT